MARKRTRRSARRSPARKDTLMRRFSDSVGQGDLKLVLSYPGNPRAQRLLEMLLDPAYRTHSLAKLCERAGVRRVDLMDWFRRFHLDLAILNLSRHLPQVAEETALDALAQEKTCLKCNGKGALIGESGSTVSDCPQCGGSGKIRVPGDPHARRLVLEVMGLIGRNRRFRPAPRQGRAPMTGQTNELFPLHDQSSKEALSESP